MEQADRAMLHRLQICLLHQVVRIVSDEAARQGAHERFLGQEPLQVGDPAGHLKDHDATVKLSFARKAYAEVYADDAAALIAGYERRIRGTSAAWQPDHK